MSKAIKALLDDPYFDDKLSLPQQNLLRRLFHLVVDKLH